MNNSLERRKSNKKYVICVNCGKKYTETNNVYKHHCKNCAEFLDVDFLKV